MLLLVNSEWKAEEVGGEVVDNVVDKTVDYRTVKKTMKTQEDRDITLKRENNCSKKMRG